jgi:hypothetical protein
MSKYENPSSCEHFFLGGAIEAHSIIGHSKLHR